MHTYKLKELQKLPNTAAQGTALNNRNKKITFKDCAPYINCITQINNTQVDDAHDIDEVMPMYNLLKRKFMTILQR